MKPDHVGAMTNLAVLLMENFVASKLSTKSSASLDVIGTPTLRSTSASTAIGGSLTVWHEAARLLGTALQLRPQDPALLCNRARLAMEGIREGEDEAVGEAYCEAALQADPACAHAAFLRADLEHRRGRDSAARVAYSRVHCDEVSHALRCSGSASFFWPLTVDLPRNPAHWRIVYPHLMFPQYVRARARVRAHTYTYT